jgi:hypothetical protein
MGSGGYGLLLWTLFNMSSTAFVEMRLIDYPWWPCMDGWCIKSIPMPLRISNNCIIIPDIISRLFHLCLHSSYHTLYLDSFTCVYILLLGIIINFIWIGILSHTTCCMKPSPEKLPLFGPGTKTKYWLCLVINIALVVICGAEQKIDILLSLWSRQGKKHNTAWIQSLSQLVVELMLIEVVHAYTFYMDHENYTISIQYYARNAPFCDNILSHNYVKFMNVNIIIFTV